MNKTRIAVIGAGNWGKNIIRVCHELEILAAICDSSQERVSIYTKEFNVPYQSWQDILSDDSLHAIAIALPARMHAEYIEQALNHNKHVFVEKPLAMDKPTAQKLCVLAQKKNKTIMVGHILQYHNAYIKLKDIISSNEIGQVRYIESTRLHLGPIRYDPGIIWELLPHDISMLLGVCHGQTVTDINVSQQHIYNNHTEINFCDTIDINLKFSDGVLARIYSSWLHPKKEQKFWVAGTKGMLVFEDTENWDNKLRLYKYNNSSEQTIVSEQKIALTPLEPLKAEINHFVDCIKNNHVARTDGYEGTRVVGLLSDVQSKLTPVKFDKVSSVDSAGSVKTVDVI